MNILVTGGSGFIGRWVVKRLLKDDNRVWVLDDLSNGRVENLDEFRDNPNLDVTIGDRLLRMMLLVPSMFWKKQRKPIPSSYS